MERKKILKVCPICGKGFSNLPHLVQHIAYTAQTFEMGIIKRRWDRERHHSWLKNREIPNDYNSVKQFLETNTLTIRFPGRRP